MKNQFSTTKVVYHVFLPWWFYGIIFGCIVAAPCCLAEWVNNLSHGGLLRWANEGLVYYWHFLNAVFSLGEWKYGFGSFWSHHPFLAIAVFLAIPTVAAISTFWVLKRERLAASIIILLLYAWHYGLSTFIHTSTQWMTLLVVGGSALSLLWSFRFVHLLRSTFSKHVRRNCFNNRGDEMRKSFSNYSIKKCFFSKRSIRIRLVVG